MQDGGWVRPLEKPLYFRAFAYIPVSPVRSTDCTKKRWVKA